MARNYLETHIPAESKVLVYAEMTRLPSLAAAIKEQAFLDPNSLRHIDNAEAALTTTSQKSFHALNLYAVKNNILYENIHDYARKNHYEYLMIDPYFSGFGDLHPLRKNGTLIATFGEHNGEEIPRDGRFGNIINLFTMQQFGPRIEIYKLHF